MSSAPNNPTNLYYQSILNAIALKNGDKIQCLNNFLHKKEVLNLKSSPIKSAILLANRIHKSWHRYFLADQNLDSAIALQTKLFLSSPRKLGSISISTSLGSRLHGNDTQENISMKCYTLFSFYLQKFHCFYSFSKTSDEQLQFLLYCSSAEFQQHLKQMAIFMLASAARACPKQVAANIMKVLKKEEKITFSKAYSLQTKAPIDWSIKIVQSFVESDCILLNFSATMIAFLTQNKQNRRCMYYRLSRDLSHVFLRGIGQKDKALAVYDKWFKLYLEHENPNSR